MESLLSVAFDNISSRDSAKIRKGLRQIEGLLAQLCLPKTIGAAAAARKRKPSALGLVRDGKDEDDEGTFAKKLQDLRDDPAYREFFRLQEGFQWNVASRLVSTLERLLGMGYSSQTDLLIASALELLQGVLLLHPPSRILFGRELHMNILLDLLDSENPPKIQSHALLVLVTALLDCPHNTRTFEQVDGLLTVTSLFKSRGTSRDVKMKTLEFLYFYLMPEAQERERERVRLLAANSAPNTAVLQYGPNKMDHMVAVRAMTHAGDTSAAAAAEFGVDGDDDGGDGDTRTMLEKQELLGRHLNNVAELVQDLRENNAFAAATAAVAVGA